MLYSTIWEKLSESIVLDVTHRNFLTHTFGIEAIEDIRQFLCTDSQDIMTFYDWLFFPDMTFQKQIESILSGKNISAAAQSDLIDRLVKKDIQSKIRLDTKTYQTISIGPTIILPFVNRLRLTNCIPEILIDIPYPDENRKNYVLVYLRNATIEWTDTRCRFIYQIIESFLNNQEDLLEILPQMLNFCGQYQLNFIQELARRKRQLGQNLERFQNLQDLQEKHSMEFLVSSGIRSIHVDVLQSEAEIAIIDKVIFELNGGTGPLPLPNHFRF